LLPKKSLNFNVYPKHPELGLTHMDAAIGEHDWAIFKNSKVLGARNFKTEVYFCK
jgi:hypothetical protein